MFPKTPTPERVVDIASETGEGPLWHSGENVVYWCDIPNGRLYRYDPERNKNELAYKDNHECIGGFTIQSDGSILLFQEAGAVRRFDPDDGCVTTIVDADPDRFHERFNDVIADPEGRVFAGVMPDVGGDLPGQLYRLDHGGSFDLVREKCDLPNGMDFTPDCEGFYFTDTCEIDPTCPGYIYRYDYDRATGDISNPTVVVDAAQIAGFPDGMTLDAEGYVWSAFWNGHKLMRFAPDGTHEQTVRFSPRKVSSIIFGGTDYADAYVTTACVDDHDREINGAGSLYRVDLGVEGRPEFRSKIEV